MMSELLEALPNDIADAARRVLEAACSRDISITTAESCTGGLLASILTDVEGASHAFDRGFVVYSEQAKCELLGIGEVTIARCGAVSRETAEAMAAGALAASHGDIALAITGFAGPGADGDEEGLVHFACARRGGGTTHREAHFGAVGRGRVRVESLRVALDMLERAIEG